ncbi:MAG: hypothetical protein LAN64_14145 [Acidobacteriia bacterium]|nr:hypothetical protein [Terriglobia bacterium]
MARIAILGWGSLIWDRRDLPIDGDWRLHGPVLKLEFSRRSADGRLTLVIDTTNGQKCPTRFAESARRNLEDAICDLQHREGTSREYIGAIETKSRPSDTTPEHERQIWCWAAENRFDAVIWTNLPPRVPREWKEFSVTAAEEYLKNLPGVCQGRAREYLIKAPPEVDTPLRRRLRTWLEKS